jgi:hypothetical protein
MDSICLSCHVPFPARVIPETVMGETVYIPVRYCSGCRDHFIRENLPAMDSSEIEMRRAS